MYVYVRLYFEHVLDIIDTASHAFRGQSQVCCVGVHTPPPI